MDGTSRLQRQAQQRRRHLAQEKRIAYDCEVRGVHIQALDFARGVDDSLRRFDGLSQASSHPYMEHGEAGHAASFVHVRMPQELLPNALAALVFTESWPWIHYSIFGLYDEEHRSGSPG